MVDARGDLDRIERRRIEAVLHALAPEFRVFSVRDVLIPLFHRLNEVLYRLFAAQLQVLCQFLISLTPDGEAAVDKLLRQRQVVHQVLVKHNVAVAVRLLQLRLRHHVARRQVVHKAPAFGVHNDRTLAAQRFGHQRAVRLNDRRMKLDLIHIHRVRTDRLRHHDAVAGRAGVVRGYCIRQARVKA